MENENKVTDAEIVAVEPTDVEAEPVVEPVAEVTPE